MITSVFVGVQLLFCNDSCVNRKDYLDFYSYQCLSFKISIEDDFWFYIFRMYQGHMVQRQKNGNHCKTMVSGFVLV